MFDHPPISTFYKSRVAITGDAAHASSPHQGAGAGQAIEDAHVLAELLANNSVTTADHVTTAFKAYDAVRRPRSQRVVSSSREIAALLCLRLPGVEDDEDKLRASWHDRMNWLWNINVEQQAESACHLAIQNIREQTQSVQ